MRTTITSKGQITIPARLRRRFGLTPGTVLEFDEDAPVLTARRVVSRSRMEKAAGVLEAELAGKTSADWLEELRGADELPAEG
jgi:AbrB family looped-hinge helix DNA binding protein